jgi:hypothetical protein
VFPRDFNVKRHFGQIVAATTLMFAVGCAKPAPDQNEPDKPSLEEAEFEPARPVTRRLTQTQYARVVKDVLGDDIVVPSRLEPDIRDNGSIALGSAKTTISPRGVELYEEAAYAIAEQALDEEGRDELVGCQPSGTVDADCATAFVETVGRRLWRRPLDEDEVSRLVDVAGSSADTLGDFHVGLQFALAAMLQSPNFLFRTEIGEKVDGERRLTSFELATRLSFFLWNTTPDDVLLDAASDGSLDTPEGLETQIERMLEDDRARDGVRRFFTDLYELDRLDDLVKAPEIYEHASEEVGPSAREETLRTIEWLVFDQHADFRDFMTTRTTFLNRKLASMYEVRAPAREGFGRVEYPEDSPRVGFLGQASFLALAAHPVSTSPTLRGKFMRQKLLCHSIPPPPAGVDTSIPEPSGDAPTLRARIQEHLQAPACSSCHLITDPIGLGLEQFDGIGRYRTKDNGVEIDPSGDLDGTPFQDARSLAELIRNHEDFGPCLTQKMYAYAVGHEPESNERDLVDLLAARWAADEYDLLALMKDVAMSPGFRRVSKGGE